nr:hypothetical protein [Tanacetum cinerariifolium]
MEITEDPVYYHADRGNNEDDESSNDDDDDDDVKKDEEDKDEEEHPAPADPSDVSTDDLETMTTVNQRMRVEEIKRVVAQRDCLEQKNQNHENQIKTTKACGVVHAFGGGETEQDLNNIEDEIE